MGLAGPALVGRPRDTLRKRAATLDKRHQALLKLQRELTVFGRLAHMTGPRGTLLFGDLESVVCATHDRKPTALLGMQRRTTE